MSCHPAARALINSPRPVRQDWQASLLSKMSGAPTSPLTLDFSLALKVRRRRRSRQISVTSVTVWDAG